MACGKARGRQMSQNTGDYGNQEALLMGDDVLCVAVHGDAALSGQVQRELSKAEWEHYQPFQRNFTLERRVVNGRCNAYDRYDVQ